VAQDDYYYEIQLTNKQLVFYFVAGAMGLILSFLAGVMVGRGVDAAGGDVQAAAQPVQTIREADTIVPESPRPASPLPAVAMSYPTLENDRGEPKLQKPSADKGGPAERPAAGKTTPTTKPSDKPAVTERSPQPAVSPATRPASPSPSTATARTTPPAKTPPARPASGAFTVQVGAFKEKLAAETIVSRLKTKGYAAYVTEGAAAGLFNVRVGSYGARTDAERVRDKLRDEEKFKPFIVTQ
jgi:cell division septation protein DedD